MDPRKLTFETPLEMPEANVPSLDDSKPKNRAERRKQQRERPNAPAGALGFTTAHAETAFVPDEWLLWAMEVA
jgi:hypothetical protein